MNDVCIKSLRYIRVTVPYIHVIEIGIQKAFRAAGAGMRQETTIHQPSSSIINHQQNRAVTVVGFW